MAAVDTATVTEDAGATAISVLANDLDIDGGPIGIFSVTQPANGAVVNNGTNVTYQPNADYCNSLSGTPDTFSYTLSPGGSTAAVSVTVTCVNDPPSVTPPAAYAAHAHIAINIPDGATDLFEGSIITDVDGPGAAPFSITAAGPFASTNGGSVTIAGNGKLTYNPPVGFTGANDTFLYQICDSGVPGSACTDATATVTVSGPLVWFVNNALGAAGDGRLSSPFNTLAAADSAANATGDRIFVFTGASTYTLGFGLLTNQRLIGQGVVDTNFDTALGITPPATSVVRPGINGTRPIINGTIALATGGTTRGFNVNNTTTNGVTGSGATGLTVNQVSVTTTTGVAVNLANSGGTVSFTSVSANGAANGIVLQNTTGGFIVTGDGNTTQGGNNSGGTIQSTTGDGISLTNTTNVSLNNMNFQNTAGHGINGTGVNTFSFTNGKINGAGTASDHSCVSFDDLNAANVSGTFTFTNNQCTQTEANGVDIENYGATLSDVNISNNQFTDTGDVATPGSAVLLIGNSTASTSGVLTKATLEQQYNHGLPCRRRLRASGQHRLGCGHALSPTALPATPQRRHVTGNLMNGGNGGIGYQPDRFVTGGINRSGQGNYNVSNNGTVANPIQNIDCIAIELQADGPVQCTTTVNNNFINANNAVGLLWHRHRGSRTTPGRQSAPAR